MSLVPALGAEKLGSRWRSAVTTCVTWAQCFPALDLSFLISKMGLGPVELISRFSFRWMSVEEDPLCSQDSSRLFPGECPL